MDVIGARELEIQPALSGMPLPQPPLANTNGTSNFMKRTPSSDPPVDNAMPASRTHTTYDESYRFREISAKSPVRFVSRARNKKKRQSEITPLSGFLSRTYFVLDISSEKELI